MTLLPLACEPLEYLRGKFSSHEKQQDRVCNEQPANMSSLVLLWYFQLKSQFAIHNGTESIVVTIVIATVLINFFDR